MSVLVFSWGDIRAAGTTSAAFLRLGAGARATAMADAFTSRADDASSPYWNPAGMSRLVKRELLAEHTLHIQDIAINRLSYVHPLFPSPGRGRRALGISASYLSMTGIEARSGNTARPDYTFGASDFYGAVSYSHPFSASASLGLTGKFIQQKLDTHRAGTYAVDIGVLQRLGKFRFGAALVNVGPSVEFIEEAYPLPQALRGGVSVDPKSVPLALSLEAEKLKDEPRISYRLGMEYQLGGMLAFRMGYTARPGATQRALKGSALGTVSDSEFNRLTGMAGGIGINLFGYAVDYSFTPYGELGGAHKMSLSAKF